MKMNEAGEANLALIEGDQICRPSKRQSASESILVFFTHAIPACFVAMRFQNPLQNPENSAQLDS